MVERGGGEAEKVIDLARLCRHRCDCHWYKTVSLVGRLNEEIS